MNYSNFLKAHKVSHGEPCNFVVMSGGNYVIQNKDPFLNLFVCNLGTEKTNDGGIVFKVEKSKLFPLIIDIDLDLSKKLELESDVIEKNYHNLVALILNEFQALTTLNEAVEIIVTRRPESCYFKPQKKVWRAGFHLYIVGQFSLTLSKQLRETCLKNIDFKSHFAGWGCKSTDEQIYDKALSERRNGTILIGSAKPQISAGAHFIFFHAAWRNGFANERFFKPGWRKTHMADFRNIFYRLYSFIWDAPSEKICSGKTPHKVSSPKTVNKGLAKSTRKFNLKAFLEATKGHVPNNLKYNQVCAYFASQGLEPKATCDICNPYWGYSDRETQTLMQKAVDANDFRVTKASMIEFLQDNATQAWDEREIFGTEQPFGYDTFLEMFDPKTKKAHNILDVQRALKHTVAYVKELDQFTHLVEREVRDPNGNKTTLTHREFSKHAAFAGNDGFKVRIFPSKEELIKILRKMIPKNPKSKEAFDLQDSVKKCIAKVEAAKNDKDAFDIAQEKFGSKIKHVKKPTHTILADLHDGVELKRYSNLVFLPYIGTLNAYLGKNELNTFDGFPLDGCPPSQIDVKSTLIWEYLVSVWGWNGSQTKQLDFLLDLIAFKLQYPRIRTERIILLISEKQGTGKSFFFELLTMIFGARYCNFHDSMDQYITRFNITDAAKIHIWLDDIQTATKEQTRQLFPKVTTKQQEYEKKNETKFTLKEYSEIWITANSDPLYLTPEERRQLFFKASDYKLQDRQFFKRVYRETKLLSHSRAFFHFFKNRDVSNFDPGRDPCPEIKGKAVEKCMAKPILFIKDFFCTSNWFQRYPRPNFMREFGLKKIGGKVRLRISRERLYLLFTCYMKDFYSGSRCHDVDSFFRSIEKVGIKLSGRLMIGPVKRYCIDIYFTQFKKTMEKLYKGIDILTWVHEENFDDFVQNMENFDKFGC
jgi:hypothetical protein